MLSHGERNLQKTDSKILQNAKSDHPSPAGLQHFPRKLLLHTVHHRDSPQPVNNIQKSSFFCSFNFQGTLIISKQRNKTLSLNIPNISSSTLFQHPQNCVFSTINLFQIHSGPYLDRIFIFLITKPRRKQAFLLLLRDNTVATSAAASNPGYHYVQTSGFPHIATQPKIPGCQFHPITSHSQRIKKKNNKNQTRPPNQKSSSC